ncbi:MAG: hypothetical protein SFX73_14245 [Kofleriaceae bacterium]|nr:hypothetical protein [Kofleriaceae bacterium]
MRARGWVFAMVLVGGVAGAQPRMKDPKPQPVDTTAFRDQLRVFKDGNGGTYVVVGEKRGAHETRVWYGTGKQLFEQLQPRRSADGDNWSIATYAPRVDQWRPGAIAFRDGRYMTWCGDAEEATLSELTGDKAKKVLDAVQLVTTAIIRVPHMLARDDRGVYYYVDRLSKPYGGKGYRVLVGRKGALKEMPLVDVASDSSGEVFSTKSGDLRLVRTDTPGVKPEMRWIKGKTKIDLVFVDTDTSERMIFRELGVYKSLGTWCDNL